MYKRILLTGLLILVVISSSSACRQSPAPFECTDAIGCVTIEPGKPLKIGVLQDLSGGAVAIGEDQTRAIELVVAERDDQLLGHPIALQIEDEGCTSEGGSVAASKLAADPQVVAVLGTTCSGSAVTAAEVIAEAGLVMISGSNSTPGLTSIGGKRGADWQPGYFRTMPNDAGNGYAAAVFAFQELGVTRAATMNDGDAYTRGSTDAFSQVFAQLGGEIVLDATINKGDTNMGPVLTAVADHEAQLLFLALFSPEGIQVIQQAKEMTGLKDVLLIGAGSLRVEDFVQAVGTHGLGMYFVGAMPPPASAAGDKLLAAYQARYGVLPNTNNYPFAYDAANLLLDAIASLAVQEADGTLHIGRQALRDALYAVTTFQGVTGRLACDEFGDCGVPRYNIVRLDDPAAGRQGLESNVVYTYTPGQ